MSTPIESTDAPAIADTFPELGSLPVGAIVTEAALARIFHRHPESVKRAVDRGELPAPAKMFGQNAWTAGAIIRHMEKRLDAAAKVAERRDRTLTERCA